MRETITAGMLRHKVYLMKRVVQPDELGGHQEQWIKAFTSHTWAHIKTNSGRTNEVAQQDTLETTYSITMRGKPSVNEAMVVWWPLKNLVYSIDSIERKEQHDRVIVITGRVRRDLNTRGW